MAGQRIPSLIDRYTLLSLLVITVLFVGIPSIPQVSAHDEWCETSICDKSWQFRKSITIDKDKVGADNNAGTLTNHPVLISFTGTDFTDVEDETQSSGQDIRFTTRTGTDLDYEIEKYDEGANTMAIWVEVPSISKSADTILYMYYGNTGVSSAANSGNTWNSDYVGVWHMNQTSGGASTIKDSTSNNNQGTDNNIAFGSTGQISTAFDYDGGEDYVTTTSNDLKTADDFTIEVWFNSDDLSSEHHIIWQGDSSGNGFGSADEMHISTGGIGNLTPSDDDSLVFYMGGNDANQGTVNALIIKKDSFTDTTNFHHIVVTVSDQGTSPSAVMYLDGASIGTDTGTTASTDRTDWDTNLRIGAPGNTSDREFDGIIDEVRISTVAKDADYVKTVFNNENSPSTFYSVGTEVSMFSHSDSTIGESVATRNNPSFTKFLAPNEYPLSISDTDYAYDDFATKKTTTLKVGEPIQIKVLASDDGGGSDIKRISLYMNLHGANRELYQSNTAISFVNHGEPTIRNSEGIIDTYDVIITPNGLKQLVTFNIKFAKEMPLSDIIIQAVDEVNNSMQIRAVQSIQVIKENVVEETIPNENIESPPEKIPNWIKQRTKAWTTDSTSDAGFAQGLTGMINENILKIPNNRITAKDTSDISFEIPTYLKYDAKLWTDGLISESEFINLLQFLLDNHHITIKA